MARHPDEIMADFETGTKGLADIDIDSVLWEIIYDILDSVKLACTTYDNTRHPHPQSTTMEHIHTTVEDYITNHYGDK